MTSRGPAADQADFSGPLHCAGRRVLVCGLGVAGAASARVLLDRGARVELADAQRRPALAQLEAAGARYAGNPDVVPDGTDLIVASPGWHLDLPLFVRARAAGIEVIGEIELAWRLRAPGAAPWLAVTGTNGKTTTVRMLESILRAGGLRALAVGNVGVPVVEAVAAGAAYDVLAVELSSYQLAWSNPVGPSNPVGGPAAIRPVAGALLNLAADHLDWHGSMAAYIAAKASILCGDTAIGNADDDLVASVLRTSTPARTVAFTVARPPRPGEFGVLDGFLVDQAFGDGTVGLLPAAEVRPAGLHNVANALAAAALARAFGVGAEAVAAGLRAFEPDPHRNAFVATVAGVDYVDDSKATNPHAAAAALAAYQRVVWVAGGQLKDVDIDPLVAELSRRPGFLLGVVLLGADRAQIAAALARHAPDVPVIDVPSTDDGVMSEVVPAASALATAAASGPAGPDGPITVLLSPAAASYDMFSSYADRGTRFAQAVGDLAVGDLAVGDLAVGDLASSGPTVPELPGERL